MIQLLRHKSAFSRNVLTLMTGTTFAQAIPVAISPILTRIYSPDDFGVLAIFIAITAILGVMTNARYELAIMLPEKDEDAINIAALGMLISTAFSIILLFPAVLLNHQISSVLGNEEIGFWLYFVPVMVWLTGMYNVLNYLNTRKKTYKDIAKAKVYKSIAMASVQLGIGFVKSGASGLIWGHIASLFVSNFRLIRNAIANYDLKKVSYKIQKEMALRHISFPKYSLWAGLANTSSFHITSILISNIYSLTHLGFYSLMQRALDIPASLIGSAIGQVFYQEAREEKQLTGSTKRSFSKTLKKLFLIGLLIFSMLYWVVEDVFAFVFGEEWRVAGIYAQILIPLVFVRFFVSPLIMMNVIYEKNRVDMYWQFSLLLLQVGLIIVASLLDLGFEEYLHLMVLIISLHYLLILMIVSKYSNEASNV